MFLVVFIYCDGDGYLNCCCCCYYVKGEICYWQ